jgi:hypothetical protein
VDPAASFISWVQKRDGRLVPFEADKISRGLFAATESLGKPDPFLSRELTDSILHFLAAEITDGTATANQIAELVIKVVRELGQPVLARAFAEGRTRKEAGLAADAGPTARPQEKPGIKPEAIELARWVEEELPVSCLRRRIADHYLAQYALHEVFARDIAAAHREGLLLLGGLENSLELDSYALPASDLTPGTTYETIHELQSLCGRIVALDGLEFRLAQLGLDTPGVMALARALRFGWGVAGLRGIVNLNSATPPAWAASLAAGPLFPTQPRAPGPPQLAEYCRLLLDEFLRPAPNAAPFRIDWHLGMQDFQPEGAMVLNRLVRRALEGEPLTFVFDRPRQVVALAEGLDRQHPALLLRVGLVLPRLLQQLNGPVEPDYFLEKLGSLARLAISAATQKRELLRRRGQGRPGLSRGFLLDRARLVVVPVGLDATTRALLGQGICSGGAPLAFARQVIERLTQVLREDGRARLLETDVDSAGEGLGELPAWKYSGLMGHDLEAGPLEQLRAAGVLHAAAGAGTVAVQIGETSSLTPEKAVELLQMAWRDTEVVRIRFEVGKGAPQQLTAPWEQDHGPG